MPLKSPLTRIVYFRISEEDFKKLTCLCETQGVRSLSELARLAMQNMLGQSVAQPTTADIEMKLQQLERMLAELNQALRSTGALTPLSGPEVPAE